MKSHLSELPRWLAAEAQLEPNFVIPSTGILFPLLSEILSCALPLPAWPRTQVKSFSSRAFPPQSWCWIPLSDRASFPVLDHGPEEQLGRQG